MKILPTRTDILDDSIITSAWKTFYGDIRDYISQMLGGNSVTTLEVVDGTLHPDRSVIAVDTEEQAHTDELLNISIDNLPDSQWLFLFAANAERAVTVMNGSIGDGSISTFEEKNIILSTDYPLILQRKDSGWIEVDIAGYARASDKEFEDGNSDKFVTTKQIRPFTNTVVSSQLGVVLWCMKPLAGGLLCDETEHDGDTYPDLYAEIEKGTLQSTTYEDYASRVASAGFCDDFALDVANKKFKCPALESVKIGGTDYKAYVGAFNSSDKSIYDLQFILDQCLAIQKAVNEKGVEIDTSATNSLQEIDTAKTDSLTAIDTAKTTSITEITTEKTNSVNAVATEKDNALNALEAKKQEIIAEGESQKSTIITTGNSQLSSINTAATQAQDETKRIGRIWATGTDEEVNEIAPDQNEHSARVYAEQSKAQADRSEAAAASTEVGIGVYSDKVEYAKDDIVINVAADGSVALYKSLESANKGNPLTDKTKWEEISLGGDGGVYNHVSNCIIGNPYHLNYKIDGDTFTLLPGSVLPYPDGSKLVTETEMSISGSLKNNLIFVNENGLDLANQDQGFYCGPMPTGEVITDMLKYWLNTETNTITKRIGTQGFTFDDGSYPLPIFNGAFKDSDSSRVFYNGIGYCHSYMAESGVDTSYGLMFFVPSGVKGLIPNGLNEDGTFKNIEHTTNFSSIKFDEIEDNNYTVSSRYLAVTADNEIVYSTKGYYVSKDNFLIDRDTGNKVSGFEIGYYHADTKQFFAKDVLDLSHPDTIIYWDD